MLTPQATIAPVRLEDERVRDLILVVRMTEAAKRKVAPGMMPLKWS